MSEDPIRLPKIPPPPRPPNVVVEVKQEEPSTGAKIWAFTRKYILAPIPLLIILAGAVVLIALGAKNIQIGGIIGKLLGRKDGTKKAIDVANTIPEDRVDSDGNLIPIGKPDEKGITQAKVVPIKKPGLFDDPTKVKVTDPEDGKDIEVDLPKGVEAKDVEHVVVVSPKVTAVTVKNDSKVSAQEVDDLLDKYGNL